MSLALYRKYRPRTFAEVIGQEHVTEPLSQALRSGRLHHAYLFSGPRGCGKTSSARILARSLNCEQGPTPEPCGVCTSCRSLMNDGAGSIDVIEIDAASHGGVEDARDLREKAFFAPANSRFKIYVIDEAHMVSPAGFNALLKLVEEPPDYVKFIFATTEPEKVLGTIRSRTHHYPFRLIPPAVLRPYLQQLTEAEGVAVEPAVFPLVVRAGGGSARDSLSVLDQLIAGAGPDGVSYARAVALLGVTDVTLLDDMCDALAAGDGASAFATIDRVAEAGHDPRRFASDLLERFRDLIVLQQVPDAVTKGLIDGPADQLEAMAAQATRLGPATLSRSADIVHNGLVDMRGTTAPRLLLELITARMLLPAADDSAGALLQRLERMERRLALTPDPSVRGELPPTASEPTAEAVGVAPAAAPPVSEGSTGRGGLSAARAAAAAASRRVTGPAPGGARAAQPPTAAEPATSTAPAASDAPTGASVTSPAVVGVGGAPTGAGVTPPGAVGAGGSPAQSAEPDYDDEPPWDDEPEPDFDRAEPAPQPDSSSHSQSPSRAVPASRDESPSRDESSSTAESRSPAEPGPRVDSASRAEPGSQAESAPRVDSAVRGGGGVPAVPPQAVRRSEPAGVLPDAPEESGAAAVNAAVPGALDVTAVREVWPEIITAIGRQSKKVAALASGATVRDLDGNTVVLTFRFPAHAKMVAPEAPVISDALYEALGGRWEVRCEVAGEGGAAAAAPTSGAPSQGPGRGSARGNGPQNEPARGNGAGPRSESARGNGSQTSAQAGGQQAVRASERAPQSRRRTEDTPPPSDDDWPEPAQPGGPGPSAPAPVAIEEPAEEENGWPEVRQIGGSAPDPTESGGSAAAGAGGSIGVDTAGGGRPSSGGSASTASPGRAKAEQSTPGGTVSDGSRAGDAGAQVSVSAGSQAPAGSVGAESQVSAAGSQVPPGSTGAQSHGSPGSTGAQSQVSPGSLGDQSRVSPGSLGGQSRVPPGSSGDQSQVPPGSSGAGSQVSSDSSGVGAHGSVGAAGAGAPGSVAKIPAGPSGATQQASASSAASVASAAGGSGRTAGGRNVAPKSGLAAARAAAAAANARGAGVRPGAKPAAGDPAWPDGSPAEEAPYDPEFDGAPAVAAPVSYEGFDPGDEPLDVVIDEKTARESSEQQAMRLLQEAFGAEKIGES